MIRKICLAICVLILLGYTPVQTVYADDILEDEPSAKIFSASKPVTVSKQPPRVEAGAAVVMDVESGRVLYEKNAYSRRAMASTTKIMTAILALENGNLDDVITVSERAASIWGSVIHLKKGQKITLRELLYGLMMNSGNDAAIAIAEYIGGTVENFADMMTQKAQEIGAMNTSFKTPHGLDAPDHYTTAYDLALITRYALGIEMFNKIVRTVSTQISIGGLYNTNEMLGAYPGADGVKTGYTGQAGRCLVTSVTRNNWRIISVVLNCSTRTARARSSQSILDYAFNNYKPTILVEKDEKIKQLPVNRGITSMVPVQTAGEIRMPLREDEKEAMETQVELPDSLEAPVHAGDIVGNIRYLVNGKVIAQTELKTMKDIRRKGFWDYFRDVLWKWGQVMSPNKAEAILNKSNG